MPRSIAAGFVLTIAALAGCADAPAPQTRASVPPAGSSAEPALESRRALEPRAALESAPATDPRRPASPGAASRRVVFLGDSLTAGLGLSPSDAYPALIEQRLASRGKGWTVVNAGVSGDT